MNSEQRKELIKNYVERCKKLFISKGFEWTEFDKLYIKEEAEDLTDSELLSYASE